MIERKKFLVPVLKEKILSGIKRIKPVLHQLFN